MAKEADFYSTGEAAKALGIPEIQVFAMLSSGKLEGQQDQWARWRIPAGAVARAQQGLKPSSEPGGSSEDDAESHAAKIEAGGVVTTNRSDQASLQKPPSSADVPSGEETTQEAVEAPVPTSSPASDIPVARAEEKDHYTPDEAAQILELSPACVRQMLRAGELEGERREKPIEGVLGPWKIPKRAVHALREGDPSVLRDKRRNVCDVSTTTTARLPLLGETTTDTPSEALLAGEEVSEDRPSEASELLSESVREVREKAEALRKELELLEGRLELMEITESALREGFQREKERADREQEKADRLQAELERERARQHGEPQGSWRRLFGS